MNKIAFCLLLLVMVFFNCCTNKPTNAEFSLDNFLNKLHSQGKFNGVVAISKDGEMVFNKAYGHNGMDEESFLSINHRFNIGSIYKEFPAVAIGQLVDCQLIRFNDSIIKYLPNLPPWASEVKIMHLLQYSSGLPSVDWITIMSSPMESQEGLLYEKLMQLEQLQHVAGKGYIYSNYNPLLLMKIVEQVTGFSF